MTSVRSLGYLHQRMLERAEDAAVALRAAIGPASTDLATLQQQAAAPSLTDTPYNPDHDNEDIEDRITNNSSSSSSPYLHGILTSLDSSSDEARIDGLRRIIAAIAAGRHTIAHASLPAVLKLTSSSITSPHVRKLVSIILARSAHAQPDLALLAVNSFQRDLSNHSPLIRASALRALGSLRIPLLAPILRLAIASAARDSHPHVRRIAALSLSKAYALDPQPSSPNEELVSILILLLHDRSPSVLGAALVAYAALGFPEPPPTSATSSTSPASTSRITSTSVYDYDDADLHSDTQPAAAAATAAAQREKDVSQPTDAHSPPRLQQYTLLHPFYRKLCLALADMDEWTQSHALQTLLLYARANFVKPAPLPTSSGSAPSSTQPFLPTSQKNREEKQKQDIEAFFATDDDDTEARLSARGSSSTAQQTDNVPVGIDEKAVLARRNPDLDLLLTRAHALLLSRSPTVIFAVVRLFYFLGPPPPLAPFSSSSTSSISSPQSLLVRPLLRYVRPSTPPEQAYLAIINLLHLVTSTSSSSQFGSSSSSSSSFLPLLQPYLTHFLPRPGSDPLYLSLAKVEILVQLCAGGNIVGAGWVLAELEWLARVADVSATEGGASAAAAAAAAAATAQTNTGDVGKPSRELGQDAEFGRRESEAGDGGRLARRAVEGIGQIVQLVRHRPGSQHTSKSDPEANEITQRALDILLRLIRSGTSGKTALGIEKLKLKKSGVGARGRSGGGVDEDLQPGVVACAITVLRTLLQARQRPSLDLVPDPSSSLEPSADELSTGRILSHFPTLLFGNPPSSASATAVSVAKTTTTTNAEGKTVQIIRRPKIVGKNALVDPEARANLFWLLGQHCQTRVSVVFNGQQQQQQSEVRTLAELIGPDLIRRAALNFGNEASGTKLAILGCAAKIGVVLAGLGKAEDGKRASGGGGAAAGPEVGKTVEALVGYLMQLGRYDADYDVRDRARFLKALGRGVVSKSSAVPITPAVAAPPGPSVTSESEITDDKTTAAAERSDVEEQEGNEKTVQLVEDEVADEGEEEVGGVKLRREQVLLILFEGKDVGPVPSMTAQEGPRAGADEEEDTSFGTLALALSATPTSTPQHTNVAHQSSRGRRRRRLLLLRGWQRGAIPRWATAEEATPSRVRDPPSVAPPSTTTTAAASSTSAAKPKPVADAVPAVEAKAEAAVEALAHRAQAHLRSASSSHHAPGTPTQADRMAAPLVHAAAGAGTGAGEGRYKDLEDFLGGDEDDEDMEEIEVEVVDQVAPEDDEYEYEDDEYEEEEKQLVGGGAGGSKADLPPGSESNAWAS
ncbi:AP-3 complex subunit beta [Tilletia horrida]|uniref:AP-3 complex subunit beta n=1 Tax=Tilletia horrida TaxID=155126 RepID=A0AAN6JWN0_9BASI|nr:AP-3 complex subunit beta [Tilletia horrida]